MTEPVPPHGFSPGLLQRRLTDFRDTPKFGQSSLAIPVSPRCISTSLMPISQAKCPPDVQLAMKVRISAFLTVRSDDRDGLDWTGSSALAFCDLCGPARRGPCSWPPRDLDCHLLPFA